jgi:hypothetical protein
MCAFAQENCAKMVNGYEDKDQIFVLCKDLEKFTNTELSGIVKSILEQYVGPPDEVAIFFVARRDLIGVTRISGPGFTGFYYTHDNIIEINPNSSNKKSIKIE